MMNGTKSIGEKGFGFCTETEAKIGTENWYAAQMRACYQMYRQCAEECLDKLRDLGVTETV